MKRYDDCPHTVSGCADCPLSSNGRDCRNAPANVLAYYRIQRGLTQKQLADAASVPWRSLQKYEYGEYDLSNMTLGYAVKIASALNIPCEALLEK